MGYPNRGRGRRSITGPMRSNTRAGRMAPSVRIAGRGPIHGIGFAAAWGQRPRESHAPMSFPARGQHASSSIRSQPRPRTPASARLGGTFPRCRGPRHPQAIRSLTRVTPRPRRGFGLANDVSQDSMRDSACSGNRWCLARFGRRPQMGALYETNSTPIVERTPPSVLSGLGGPDYDPARDPRAGDSTCPLSPPLESPTRRHSQYRSLH